MTQTTSPQSLQDPNASTTECYCGCGLPSGKGIYRQGHDAKHVSRLAALVLEANDEGTHLGYDQDLYDEARKVLARSSANLVAKFEAVVVRRVDKAEAKQNRAAKRANNSRSLSPKEADRKAAKALEVQPEPMWNDDFHGPTKWNHGEVKVGRWTYPSRQYEDGLIVRNTKRDGSGEWVEFSK